ncbi:MAG TPA: hypothetical protein VGM07_16415 [Stellaceae bacterium]|jgi:RsiW-degrading membrane proteinase PrsW (M82 family)
MASRFTWAATAVGIAAVVAVATVMAMFWGTLGPSQISLNGWLAMILGIVASLALAIGLVTAMFISNRRGYDENPRHDL